MILSDKEIWAAIQKEEISFDPPLEPQQVSPSSIDLKLGNIFTLFTPPPQGAGVYIDISNVENVEEIIKHYGKSISVPDGEYYELKPREFILAFTEEYIKLPNHIAARVEGRSSIARLGLTIHQTAPTVHATFEGQLRLEICNNGLFNCRIRPKMKVCQLILERLGEPAESRLNSKYQKQREKV